MFGFVLYFVSSKSSSTLPQCGSQPKRREIRLTSILVLQKQIKDSIHSGIYHTFLINNNDNGNNNDLTLTGYAQLDKSNLP